MHEKIEITRAEYFELKCAQMLLSRLENGGVDNWDWYGDALNPEGEESYSDAKDKLRAEIFAPPSAEAHE